MSDEQKVWFVYLTDHHEGPFTPAEVGEKLAQGAINAQSLGWKDGMPEWLPLENIPELGAVLGGGAAVAAAPAAEPASSPAAPSGEGEGFSLAQMLASQQASSAPAPAEEGQLVSSASVLSEITGSLNLNAAQASEGGVPLGAGVGAAPGAGEVSATDDVWTLRLGRRVSGLHTLQDLIQMAGEGEIPADAKVWRPGWSDFQLVSVLPEVMQARRPRKSLGAGTAGGRGTGGIARPGGIAPITAGADLGDDEETNPSIRKPNLLARIAALFRPKAKAPKKSAVPGKKAAASVGRNRLLPVLVGVLLVTGAAAGYLYFFSPLIPTDLDVSAEDREQMLATVSAPPEQGARFQLALARGTEDNPADDTAPQFYVASNLPEGTPVSLHVVGKAGTLVNRFKFETNVSSVLGASRVGLFPPIQDDGKPLPMGEYTLTISADGAEPVTAERFLGGKNGPGYQNRLKKYKEKLQADYDKEMQELKQYVDTLKTLHADTAKRVAAYRSGWSAAGNRARILADWQAFATSANGILAQLDTKLKAHAAAADVQVFHPRAFQDVASTVAQLQQWLRSHGERLAGTTPAVNLEELEGLVQAGIVSLEQWLTQALVKNPIEVLSGAAEVPAAPDSAPAAPATPAVPAGAGAQENSGG